jgi:hypothetical protein
VANISESPFAIHVQEATSPSSVQPATDVSEDSDPNAWLGDAMDSHDGISKGDWLRRDLQHLKRTPFIVIRSNHITIDPVSRRRRGTLDRSPRVIMACEDRRFVSIEASFWSPSIAADSLGLFVDRAGKT